ncbi:Crp/Fnr family transcriptional regulator [candidate division KSB1 bacterium]|nr:Crp/Fnr family transcriptional regulator [candidate division KSB1 bacterium]
MPESLIKSNALVFKKGETIFKEGDVGDVMYIIRSGRVEIVKNVNDEELVLATLSANSFFGEMALFGDKTRSATVRALDETHMITINKAILDLQLSRVPDWFVAIMRTLVNRLKDTNKRLKSRYYINLEYSLLKMILWVATSLGEKTDEGLKAPLGRTIKDVQAILGVSKDEVLVKLKDFVFVKLLTYSAESNEIIIPDVEKLNKFLLFMQGKKDKKTRMTFDFEKLNKDAESMQYFEKIFRLLGRRKGETADGGS